MRDPNQDQEVDYLNPISINAFEVLHLNDPLHFHPSEYELTLVLGGNGIRLVGDNIAQFGNYDLVLSGPGIPHCWINTSPENNVSAKKLQIIVIHFNRHIIGEELLKRNEFSHINELLNLSERGILFGYEFSKKVANKILELKLEPDFDTFLNILDILNQLANSENYKILCSRDYIFRGRPEELNIFVSVFEYIQSNFLIKIKLSEVAALANLNDSAFSHYFKKRTQYSFTDFINLLRLNNAAKQITTQQKNIADICFDSGFNNLSNFNRMFKKWKGITPLQFRKIHMSTSDNE